MNPMMFPILIGGLVIAMVVLLFLAFRRNSEGVASDRLDALVGRNTRKDSSADMLLKQALQEADNAEPSRSTDARVLQSDEDLRAGRL